MHFLHFLIFCTITPIFVFGIIEKSRVIVEQLSRTLDNFINPINELTTSLAFELDDTKIRFRCPKKVATIEQYQKRRTVTPVADISTVGHEHHYDPKTPSLSSKIMKKAQQSRDVGFKEGLKVFKESFEGDLKDAESLFNSSLDFLKELGEKSEKGQLTNGFLDTKKEYNHIQIRCKGKKLTLKYPHFFKRTAKKMQEYRTDEESNINLLFATLSELNDINNDLIYEFQYTVRKEYSTIFNTYCNQYENGKVSIFQSKDASSEIYCETPVDMSLNEKKESFLCSSGLQQLSNEALSALMRSEIDVMNGFEKLCPLTDEPITIAVKKFQYLPTERSPYAGYMFLKRLKECVSMILPEVSKEWSAQKKDAEMFVRDVDAVINKLMERDVLNLLMRTQKLESNGVSLELKENGVVLFQWKPILSIIVVDNVLEEIPDNKDDATFKKRQSLMALRSLLINHQILQAHHINHVLYTTLKDAC